MTAALISGLEPREGRSQTGLACPVRHPCHRRICRHGHQLPADEAAGVLRRWARSLRPPAQPRPSHGLSPPPRRREGGSGLGRPARRRGGPGGGRPKRWGRIPPGLPIALRNHARATHVTIAFNPTTGRERERRHEIEDPGIGSGSKLHHAVRSARRSPPPDDVVALQPEVGDKSGRSPRSGRSRSRPPRHADG
jgi:hypothetical protein